MGEVSVIFNRVRGEFFFTAHHGVDIVEGRRIAWTLTRKLPDPEGWVSCTYRFPHRVGLDRERVLQTREEVVDFYLGDLREVMVSDLVDVSDADALVAAIDEYMERREDLEEDA